jgi:glycosyltransferase involved in cell wall biosynthesis
MTVEAMRVGIDISVLSNLRTGVENYTLKLIEGLSQVDPLNHYTLFSRTDDTNFTLPANFSFKTRRSLLNRPLWRQVVLPRFAVSHKVEVFHSPIMSFPVMGNFRRVVTIHDLLWTKITRPGDIATYLRHRFWLRNIFRFSDRIIAVSRNTKNDILNLMPDVDAGKIAVIHEAAGEEYKVVDDAEKINMTRERYKIDGPFILTVSLMRRRKNMHRLISAYSILRKEHKIDAKLVIVGKRTSVHNDLLKQCHELDLAEDVIFTGYIPTADLVHIYNAADLFVYPSLNEGFGIPVLEAMACGTPVVTSNTSALPEVAGDAAILVNPYDVEELAHAMHGVLHDEELKQTLTEKGLERAKMFSWEKTARETIEVYRQVAEQ